MSAFQLQSSEVLARLKPFGISFEKSLTDLIKGIRAHSKDSPEALLTFLSNAIQECKEELVTNDLEVKATAVLKLAYLEMYGFDMSWCNFHILEVMSSLKFQQKRIGYLAATQSFKNEQDLLILATNQFKKDLNSHNHIEIGLALSGIATIVTPNLAKDIVEDIVMKLTHSKPYIRKKSVLALFKIFLQYPESWKGALPRVIEKLDDPDVAVVSATITVVCEVSKKHPNFFIGYLPKFFTILEDTSNNWLIIRILKLFQSLLKIEPRMKKRIMPSIVNLMSKTDATSLIYESINCIVDGGMISPDSSRDKEVAKMCVDHLLKFFHQNDSNLRFVGLLALIKILHVFPTFIHKLSDVASVINLCIQDEDLIIKRKALDICHYLVTEDNIAGLVKTLLLQILPENSVAHCPDSFKLEITSKILEIASSNNYENIPNFKWYVTALKELVNLTLLAESSRLVDDGKMILSEDVLLVIASKLGYELKSLTMKVPSIRPYVISKVVMEYIKNLKLLQTCPSLLKDLYWIMGEYLDDYGLIENNDREEDMDATTSLSQKVTIFNLLVNKHIDEQLSGDAAFPISDELSELLNADLVSSAIESLVKLFSSIVTDYLTLYSRKDELSYEKYCELAFFLSKLIRYLERWECHISYEVQERCSSWLEYLKLCLDALKVEKVDGVAKLEVEEMDYYKNLCKAPANTALSIGSETNQSDEESDSSDGGEESEELDDESRRSLESQTFEQENNDGKDNDHEEVHSSQVEKFESRPIPALLSKILPSFFKKYPLNPVSASAQSRIPVPQDLDLDTTINLPPNYCFEKEEQSILLNLSDESSNESEGEAFEREILIRDRLDRLKDDPYYIKSTNKTSKTKQKKIVNLEDEAGVQVSDAASEPPSLIDLSGPPISKSRKSKKVKKEKVLVLAEDSIGDEKEDVFVKPEVKKEKKARKNKFIINTLNLESLNLDKSEVDTDLTSKPYEYEVDLNQLRTKLADESVRKAEKEKKKEKKRKEKGKVADLVVLAHTDGTEDGLQPTFLDSTLAANQDITNDANPDDHKSVPLKKKKKKKRAIIED